MSSLSRLKTSPGLLVRALVSLGAVAAIGGAVAAYTSGRTPLVADMTAQVLALVVIGALARRYGIPLPGNGFASYILGVVAYAVLDHGWPFALLVAPLAMLVGDLGLRRLPAAAALGDAAHLTAGSAVAGLVYQRLGGVVGTGALAAANLAPLAVFLAVLPATVNATYYLELALGRSLAWVDARLTARWETIVYACSAGLALVWLWLTHAGLEAGDALAVGGVLAITTMVSASVIRRAVRADGRGRPAAPAGRGARAVARAGGPAGAGTARLRGAGAAVSRGPARRPVERAPLRSDAVPRLGWRHARAGRATTRAHVGDRGVGPAGGGRLGPHQRVHADAQCDDRADSRVK